MKMSKGQKVKIQWRDASIYFLITTKKSPLYHKWKKLFLNLKKWVITIMKMSKGQKVKIQWRDSSVYSPKKKDISLSRMETIGFIEEDEIDYLIIKNPKTINILTKKKHPEKDPTFYFIPRGMIENIDIV